MQDIIRNVTEDAVNGHGRSTRHIATGVALVGGAVALSALIAATPSHPKIKAAYDKLEQPAFKPPAPVFSAVWPPLFGLLTLSGLRIWNAPPSAERSRALGFWGAIQGLNALWMALGPKRLALQTATAVATLGVSAAYAREAVRVDKAAAGMVTPFLGWITFANVLTADLLRLNRNRLTPAYSVH